VNEARARVRQRWLPPPSRFARRRATERTNDPFRAPSRVADDERSDDGNAPALSRPRDPAKSKESDSRVFVDATRAIRFLHGSVGWLIFTRKRRSVTGRTDRVGRRRSVGPSVRPSVGRRERMRIRVRGVVVGVSRRRRRRCLPSSFPVVNANVGSSSRPRAGLVVVSSYGKQTSLESFVESLLVESSKRTRSRFLGWVPGWVPG
jgi:hypothetical protein